MRKLFALLLMLGFSGLALAASVSAVNYELLEKKQPAPTDGKVEVIEFFSYACPHCYRFEPYVNKWVDGKSDNVEFVRVPAVFSKNWETLATLYYAAEVLGVQEKMHPIIFEAMHGDGKKVRSFEDLKKLFQKNGVSGEKLEQALTSFTVAAKTRRAKAMTEAYGIKSVPNVVVQGQYRTDGTLAKGHENVFKVVDELSAKIKKENQ
jgi:thiol:disulfide interchange protein DsbA